MVVILGTLTFRLPTPEPDYETGTRGLDPIHRIALLFPSLK